MTPLHKHLKLVFSKGEIWRQSSFSFSLSLPRFTSCFSLAKSRLKCGCFSLQTETNTRNFFFCNVCLKCYSFPVPKYVAYFKPDIINGKYTCVNKFILWEKRRRNEKWLFKTSENISSNNCPHLRLTLCFLVSSEKEPKNVRDLGLCPYAYSQFTQFILCISKETDIFSYHFRHVLNAVGHHYQEVKTDHFTRKTM